MGNYKWCTSGTEKHDRTRSKHLLTDLSPQLRTASAEQLSLLDIFKRSVSKQPHLLIFHVSPALKVLFFTVIIDSTVHHSSVIIFFFANKNSIQLSVPSSFPLALEPQFGPWPTSMKLSVSLRFTRSYTLGATPWAGDLIVARPLPVHKHKH
jgi:hypothetical protein